jgi:hypothetical protein
MLELVAARTLCTCNMSTIPTLKRIIAGTLLSSGIAVAGLGLAAPAWAGPSYWHYCPGHSGYTVPPPAWADLSVCHWFAVTVTRGPSGPAYNFVEADPSQVPPPAPGFPWP